MVDKQDVFKYSLYNKRFGYLQDKCIEEMSELTKAILKARERGEEYDEEVGKELADVSLMIAQLQYIYDIRTGGNFSKQVEFYQQLKCNKLWSIWHDGISSGVEK